MQQFECNDVMYLHRNKTADTTLNETLSGFKGKVENVSANQRPGRRSRFSDRHK